MSKRILVVDDESTLCETLQFNLEAAGYEADVAYSAEEALAMHPEQYSLILLDIMMEGVSGVQMAQILKRNPVTADIPIIFCTAKDSDDDMVEGLNLGADDYITKPYSLRNVLARVEAVLRRTGALAAPSQSAEEDSTRIEYRGLVLLPEQKSCMVDGVEVTMPRKEFEILQMLMTHRGRVFSREEILNRIWPEEVVVLNRVVDVNITRIRRKIGAYGKNIATRSGYGYLFLE